MPGAGARPRLDRFPTRLVWSHGERVIGVCGSLIAGRLKPILDP